MARKFGRPLGRGHIVVAGEKGGGRDVPPRSPEWETTLFSARAHGHPGLAAGPIDRATLRALHRQAWGIAGLKEGDSWKELLNIADPLERVIVAGRTGFPLSEADLSSLVMEAVACQPGDE